MRGVTGRGTAGGMVLVLAAGIVLGSAAPALAASGCASGPVAEALQVRALNSRLMVAALACEAQDDYNAFVERFDGVLARSGRKVADWFGPRGGRRALNDYVTSLANKASLDSLGDRYAFCAGALSIMAKARTMDDAGLLELSRSRPTTEAETRKVCL